MFTKKMDGSAEMDGRDVAYPEIKSRWPGASTGAGGRGAGSVAAAPASVPRSSTASASTAENIVGVLQRPREPRVARVREKGVLRRGAENGRAL